MRTEDLRVSILLGKMLDDGENFPVTIDEIFRYAKEHNIELSELPFLVLPKDKSKKIVLRASLNRLQGDNYISIIKGEIYLTPRFDVTEYEALVKDVSEFPGVVPDQPLKSVWERDQTKEIIAKYARKPDLSTISIPYRFRDTLKYTHQQHNLLDTLRKHPARSEEEIKKASEKFPLEFPDEE